MEGSERRFRKPDAVDDAGARPGLPVPAPPSVRYLARRHGLDLTRVRGSGPGGRITAEDVERALPSSLPPAREPAAAPEPAGGDGARSGVPRACVEAVADITDLERMRERYGAAAGAVELPAAPTLLAFLVKAACAALGRIRLGVGGCGDALSMAVAVGGTPPLIVRDVHRKSVVALIGEINERVRTGAEETAAAPEQGSAPFAMAVELGSLPPPLLCEPHGAALVCMLPPPEGAAVASGGGAPGQAAARTLVRLAFIYDRRVAGERAAAEFIAAVAGGLSNPVDLLLS
jgi:pyruvate dehydrogenase E2 component (dihydrolipoamide acetyltransferase)